ncbi:MAG: two-component sensor histidine kinase, partial [Burkholderiaceae bacterium]|nr:two-component sensor histidine kinase [Burkholderiaceae bacterium]
MKAFLGSMTGRVFLVLLLGMAASAALTQWLAVAERQRTIEQYRDFHALERAEQMIVTADVVPAASRAIYLKAASRGGVRLEAGEAQPA